MRQPAALTVPAATRACVPAGQWPSAVFSWLLFALLLVATATATAAEVTTGLGERAESLRNSVSAAANLSDEQKTQAAARIDEIARAVAQIDEVQKTLEGVRDTVAEAPGRIQALEAQREQMLAQQQDTAIAELSVDALQAELAEQRSQVAALQLAQEDREKRLNELVRQSRSDAGDLSSLQDRLAQLEQADSSQTEEPLSAVETLWRTAQDNLLASRIELIRLRQANIERLTELARLERDIAGERVDRAQQRLAILLEAVQARHREDAEAAISKVEETTSEVTSGLRAIQADIAQLASEQAQLVTRETEFQRRLDQVKRTSERLKRDYERIHQIVELGGSSAQVSTLLQKRREIAPSPEGLTREAFELQQALSNAGLRQIELDEVLQQLLDTDTTLAYLNAQHGLGDLTVDPTSGLRDVASIYRKTALDLWQGYTRYLTVLSQLEANTRSLAQEAQRYQDFISDRLLWVPSTELLPLSQPALLLDGLRWFVDRAQVEALWTDVQTLIAHRPVGTMIWLVILVVLWGFRKRALSALSRCAQLTHKARTDRFSATLVAMLASLVLLLWLPWLLIGGGILIGRLPNPSNSTLVYAAGLQAAGQVALFLLFIRHLCRSDGLARVHLNWHPLLCQALNRQAIWLIPLVVPLGFFVAAGASSVPSDFIRLAASPTLDDPGVVSLGRLALAAQMLFLLIAVQRVWRKSGAVIQAFTESADHAKWANYHVLWFGPALLAPLLLAGWALLGYFYSSVFILSVVGETLWFILFAIIGRDLLFRALYVMQRRLRLEEALRRRDELIAQRQADIEGTPPPEEKPVEAIDEEKVDYRQLGEQARSVVHFGYTLSVIAGLWWIWRDVFPAFSFLDGIQLPITTSQLVDGSTQDVPLTLGDMVAGLLLGGLALFAAMKVPAILELTLLQRLPMSRASRYAFTTLLQYVVAMIGVAITFNAVGLQWSSIQWLVAALGVGLGFGLQEIVANFISGIILLFEQPMRVGDVVTVDGTTGTVSKIRIRATTIVNFDRQELVIPNKTFITGQLINWTLSDTVNRVLLTVGVSYATDTREAMRLIREAADEHHNVMADPAPIITFEGFGDNALTLNLRAYLANMDNRLITITELHQAILDKFRESGIEISFPQRDVHLSTLSPLEVKLQR
jgi:potassium efflux system protein